MSTEIDCEVQPSLVIWSTEKDPEVCTGRAEKGLDCIEYDGRWLSEIDPDVCTGAADTGVYEPEEGATCASAGAGGGAAGATMTDSGAAALLGRGM